ncbi:virion structural protein [Pseudomonas phage PhiPA3]|uniref:Virion structural protein n=1 Tax=Pseudomonas phage PhiPA3 TaxID=998086 RepID=F8SJP3_BPPA3|nr:virion structural protein [Pseudomonas phage PhiPA3]AEH03438.1 virion structural protein [Pseudomonas phage PhiPA3]
MRRYSDPIAPQSGYGAGGSRNTINMAQAGTDVMRPDLANLASNTPYVGRNVIPFLLEAPRFFQYAKNSRQLVRSLKALIENHVRTIDGLQQTITVDTAEAPWGGSGEAIQAATNVTRARSTPSLGCWELQGRAIQRFLKWWITYGIGDENTKYPRIIAEGNVPPEKYDATFYGATVLFVEPDPTFQDVVSAYLCTNMFPLSTGPWESRKDAAQIGQNLDLSIEFSAMTDVSEGVIMYARQLFRTLNIKGMNPNDQRSWIESISADVRAANLGLADQLNNSASNRVTYDGAD